MHKKVKENKFTANIDTPMCLLVQIRVPASELRHWQSESKFWAHRRLVDKFYQL